MRAIIILILLFCAPFAAMAQNEVKDSPMEEGVSAQPPQPANPFLAEMNSVARSLSETMETDQVEALAQIRMAYGMMYSVKTVREDVTKTVSACVETNPDMASEIDRRYQDWVTEIDQAISDNEARLRDALHSGLFEAPAKIRHYLTLVDKAADHADSQIEKRLLSDAESCGSLVKAMDRTQSTLVELMQKLPWPETPE